ncbi:conserved hypothetical protein [Ricinus communis]|uniref:Uncharacterized protein n=1 Tax=Ricinus communis TaxID=3988 RepID=B9SXE6_RICCO|nr:conserved hypothetical protein [Ricinus communis]
MAPASCTFSGCLNLKKIAVTETLGIFAPHVLGKFRKQESRIAKGASGISVSVTSNTSGMERGSKQVIALVHNPSITEPLEEGLEGLATIPRSKKSVREIPCGLIMGQMDRLCATFKIPQGYTLRLPDPRTFANQPLSDSERIVYVKDLKFDTYECDSLDKKSRHKDPSITIVLLKGESVCSEESISFVRTPIFVSPPEPSSPNQRNELPHLAPHQTKGPEISQ